MIHDLENKLQGIKFATKIDMPDTIQFSKDMEQTPMSIRLILVRLATYIEESRDLARKQQRELQRHYDI